MVNDTSSLTSRARPFEDDVNDVPYQPWFQVSGEQWARCYVWYINCRVIWHTSICFMLIRWKGVELWTSTNDQVLDSFNCSSRNGWAKGLSQPQDGRLASAVSGLIFSAKCGPKFGSWGPKRALLIGFQLAMGDSTDRIRAWPSNLRKIPTKIDGSNGSSPFFSTQNQPPPPAPRLIDKSWGLVEEFLHIAARTWKDHGSVRLAHVDGIYRKTGWWFQPLWKIWKSIGLIIPNIWKNRNVPNHQAV